MFRRFYISLCLCCALTFGFAGIPALEREVNLSLTKELPGAALQKIQDQTGLIFSYSSTLLKNISPVSLQLKQKTVREALSLILPKTIVYKSKNNYIILKEKPEEKETKKRELSGYVYDKNTDKKLANVTVYDKSSMQAVNTDDYGFYKITVPKEKENININKSNYKDTVISISTLKDSSITNIALNPLNDSIIQKDSLSWRTRLKDFSEYTNRLFKNFKGYVNTLNVKDTLYSPFQLSLLPYVGTNHKLSGNVINHLSINIIGGYARGVDGVEAGGVFNVDKENVNGSQFAGVFNLVGDSVAGFQAAGLFNVVGKHVDGVQAAGFLNSNLGTLDGLAAAGFMNLSQKKVNGLQLAGFMNAVNDSLDGLQAAGFLNAAKHADGLQVAGFLNHATAINGGQIAGFLNNSPQGVKGGQIAGFLNTTDTLEGAQIAGFLNHAETVKGAQIAGFLNRTKLLEGYQIGVINVSDSCNGLPIGVLSFVKNGVHQLELTADEVFPVNLAFRTGVSKFYSVLSAGIVPGAGDPVWTFGYALGTSFKIKNKLNSDITLGTQHINYGDFTERTSDLYKLYLGLEYKFGKKFSIAAGPTFNLYLSDRDLISRGATEIAPYTLINNNYYENLNLKGWFGGKIALRFF